MSSPLRIRSTASPGSSAFTLIELLVVIAIIAILAALLMPVVRTARNSSNLAKSQSNIRQIAQAIFTYASDRDGQLPSAGGQGPVPGPAVENWVVALRTAGFNNLLPDVTAAVSTKSTWLCPLALATRPYNPATTKGSYAMNNYASPRTAPRRLASFGTPTKTALLMNGRWHPGLATWPQTEIGGTGGANNTWPDFPYPVRNLKSNDEPWAGAADPSTVVAFIDGHVEMVPKSRVPDPYDASNPFWGGQ
jgi:prepilin-type N-terminal cleavage/methylation domain-containing protein